MASQLRSVVRGVGAALPERVVTNAELAGKVDTSDEWILQRTGITQRYIAARGRDDLDARRRARRGRRSRTPGSTRSDIDLIIAGDLDAGLYLSGGRRPRSRPSSASPTAPPSTCRRCAPASSSRVATADKFLRSGSHKRALVIGAETFSRILDWNDRTHLRAVRRRRRRDGAGGAGAATAPSRRSRRPAAQLRSDGRHRAKLYVDGGPSTTGTVGHLRMEGKEVFRHAVGMVTDVIEDAFDAPASTRGRHRLVRAAPGQPAHHRRLGATSSASRREKVVVTVDRHGNTSAASIPLALVGRGRGRAHQAGRPGA